MIKYRIRISDSYRFMQESLSKLVDNLSELKNKEIDSDVLIRRFYNAYQFYNTYVLSGNDYNKFKLLLRKGVYPYEYMGSWKRFHETELPSKDKFYSKLNLEDMSDDDSDDNISDDALLADIFENRNRKHRDRESRSCLLFNYSRII